MPNNKKMSKSKTQSRVRSISPKIILKQQIKQLVPTKVQPRLNNIIELTEEYQTNRYNTQSIQQVSQFLKGKKKGWWQKSFNCIKHVFSCIYRNEEFSITVKEQQIIKTIQKLRTQNIKIKPFLPPNPQPKRKTLVLDIDQTLVYSSQIQFKNYQFSFTMPYRNTQLKVYTVKRFGLESFLFQMSKIFQIVVYTTNIKEYVENVIKNIDKKKRISYILHKQKCVNLNKMHFLKSLKALGRDPNQVIFIDQNIASGILQPKNFLHIKPFVGEKHDRQLVKIIPFLRELALRDSVLPVGKNYEQYINRQIKLKFNSLDQTKMQSQQKQNQFEHKNRKIQAIKANKRRKYQHKKANSELQALAKSQEYNYSKQNQSKGEQKQTQQSQHSLRVRVTNIQEL